MAYEDGYEAVNYLEDCINQYKKDPLVFVKAQQLYSSFVLRTDWPHCMDDLDSSIEKVLGISIWNLVFFSIRDYINDELIQWPKDLPEGFKDELSAFCEAIIPMYKQFLTSRTQPMSLSTISQSIDGRGDRIVRFVRMDGHHLDFRIDDHEIQSIITTLKSILLPRDNDSEEG